MLDGPNVRLPLIVVKPGLAPIRKVPLLVKVPVPRLTVPPVSTVPVFVNDALLMRENIAPWAIVIVPALVANPADELRVPEVTANAPALLKLVT